MMVTPMPNCNRNETSKEIMLFAAVFQFQLVFWKQLTSLEFGLSRDETATHWYTTFTLCNRHKDVYANLEGPRVYFDFYLHF